MQAHQPAFRLLGPLEVWADGVPLRLGGERQRALLALLLLHANEVVPSERLIEQLFGLDAPEAAPNSLQVAISRLRRLLGDGALVTRPRGYLLQVEPGELDSALFEQLLADGRRALADGDASAAAEQLREALALWRGPPLADLAPLEVVQPDIRRLEELHLAALIDRLDADLALGQGGELVPELERLVDANPLQERLRGQLMLALYRSGRQADALNAYRQTRELLHEELGLVPSPALQQLEREILNHDPGLERPTNGVPELAAPPVEPAAASTAALVPGSPTAAPRTRRRRALLIAATCAGLLVLAAAALASTRMLGSKHGLPSLDADSIGVLDPGDGRITAQLPLGARPVGVAFDGQALWISASDGTLTRVEPDKLGAFNTIPLGGNPGAVTAGGHAIWVADQDDGTVARIDPVLKRSVLKVQVGNGPSAAAFCFDSVWIANQVDGTLSRIDPHTDEPARPIPVGSAPTGIACGSGSVWVADAQDGTVTRVDPRTNLAVKTISVGSGLSTIAAGLGAVWVGGSQDGTVSRIDPATNSVSTGIPAGKSVDALTVRDGSVWSGDAASGAVSRIDPAARRVVKRIAVGSSPTSLGTAGNHLVVATLASPASHRGGTLVVVETTGNYPVTLDPATWWSTLGWNLLSVTNDGLVTYRRAGGVAGLVVVPDLAGSLPVVARGGTVQTFVLRPGIRYSDGRLVRARDIRASIERVWRMKAGATVDPDDRLGLVGESACAARPRHCDLSRGILTDDRARTVSFHLSRPNPSFLRILALPWYDVLPAGTPPLDGRPLPATGPYRVARYEPRRRVVLERNPRFRLWSGAAQPPGFPDRIVARIGVPVDRALDEVLGGRADYLATDFPLPAGRLAELYTRHGSQVHPLQQEGFRYLFLNTSIPPFDQRDARLALNYAVDRQEMVRIAGGKLAAGATCQVITPGFPGYSPHCPYTLHPTKAGAWIGPDLAKARALVRRSGTLGAKVVIWADTRSRGTTDVEMAHSMAAVLGDLGYEASVATLPRFSKTGSSPYYDHVLDPRSRVQVGLAGWGADFPATVDITQPLLGCHRPNNGAQFCNEQLEELFRRAASAGATDRPEATRLWTAIDRKVVDEAPWVPLTTFKWTDVVSRRLGNYQASPRPALGFLVDQAWVR